MSATLEAVMRDVWPERMRGYANLEFQWSAHRDVVPSVFAWRAQGDIYRFAREPVTRFTLISAPAVVQAVDVAISDALKALSPLTVSEALEAGEFRRCLRTTITREA